MRRMDRKWRKLTIGKLRRLGASEDLLWQFRWQFGEKATASLSAVVKWLHANPPNITSIYADCKYERWEAWLLSRNVELTSALVAAGACVNAGASEALAIAAEKGSLPLVELLISLGAWVNTGRHSLRRAAARGHFAVVQCLIKHRAVITVSWAIECARERGHKEIASYLQRVEARRNRADEKRIAAIA